MSQNFGLQNSCLFKIISKVALRWVQGGSHGLLSDGSRSWIGDRAIPSIEPDYDEEELSKVEKTG